LLQRETLYLCLKIDNYSKKRIRTESQIKKEEKNRQSRYFLAQAVYIQFKKEISYGEEEVLCWGWIYFGVALKFIVTF